VANVSKEIPYVQLLTTAGPVRALIAGIHHITSTQMVNVIWEVDFAQHTLKPDNVLLAGRQETTTSAPINAFKLVPHVEYTIPATDFV